MNSITNGKPLYQFPATGYGNGAAVPSLVGTEFVAGVGEMSISEAMATLRSVEIVTVERDLGEKLDRSHQLHRNKHIQPIGKCRREPMLHASPNGPCIKPYPQYDVIASMENLGILKLSGDGTAAFSSVRQALGLFFQATYDWTKDLSQSG